jgi:hypothetical protein
VYCLGEANDAIDHAFKSRFNQKIALQATHKGSLFFRNRKAPQKLAKKDSLKGGADSSSKPGVLENDFRLRRQRNPMIIWSLGLRILPSFPDFEWLRTGDFVTIRPVENKPRRRKKGVNITRNLVHDGPITANEA